MLEKVFREPLAIEAFFAAVLLVVLLMIVRTLRGVSARISRRRALREFVGGVDLFFKGEHTQARAALEAVLERDPENSEARILLGDVCRELGDVAEAHKHHYQVARVFERDLPRNRLSLGRDLLQMGKAAEAIEHLDRAAQADPDDPIVLELLLSAQLEAGRVTEAVALAGRLEDATNGEVAKRARRRRASISALAGGELVRRGEVREGERLLRNAVRLNPALVSPRLELVKSSWLNGSARAAEKELLAQLKEMTRLARDGGIIFEPPASGSFGETRGGGAGPETAALEAPRAAADSSGPALPAPGRGALPGPTAGSPLPAVRAAEGAPVARGGRGAGEASAGPGEIPEAPLPMDAGEFVGILLPREAAYLCVACGHGELAFTESCPDCGAFGSLAAADGTALAAVPEMREIFDEIVENRSFLRKLIARAAAGDHAAAARLTGAGPRAVGGILREILRVADDAPLVRVLSDMGPTAVEPILKGYRRVGTFSTKRLVREGVRAFRSLDGVVVRALAAMGPSVVPRLVSLLDSSERPLRQIAIDVLIRLGAAGPLEDAHLAIPVKDLLERLNACPEEELGPLIDAADREGPLVDRIFVDRTFAAERALVLALDRNGNRTKVRNVLIRRGFSAPAYDALEEMWSRGEVRVIVRDVIRSYGRAAADHLIKTYTSPDVPAVVRDDALALFLDLGDDEAERLVERLAEGDPETESAVLRGVMAFGNRAVPALVRAYGKSGILEKVGLNRRRLLYRKMTLLRALAQVGTYDAIQGVRQVFEREGDPELRRRIRGILDRLSGGGERR